MRDVRENKKVAERRYKFLLLIYEDECFVDFSSAKDLRNKFQYHKTGKCYATASWRNKGKYGAKFKVYLLEETDSPISSDSAKNLLLAWILYYKNKQVYKICNTELDNRGTNYPSDTLHHYQRICNQNNEPEFICKVDFEKKRHAPYTVRETDKNADIKQMNIRVTSETKVRFQDFCDTNGISPSKAMEYLLDLAEGSNSGLLDIISSQEAQIQDGKEKQRMIVNAEERISDSLRNGLIPRLELRNKRMKEFISLYNEYFLRKNGKQRLRVERFRAYSGVNMYQYPEAEYGYTVLKIQGMEWGKKKKLINVFGIDEKGNYLRFRYYSGKCYLGVSLWNASVNNDCDTFFIAYEKGRKNGSFIVGVLPIGVIPYQRKFKDETELERQFFLSDVVDLIQGVDDYVDPDYPQDNILDGDEMIWLNPRYYNKLRTNMGITQNSDSSYSVDDVVLLYLGSHTDEKSESPFSIANQYIDDDLLSTWEQLNEFEDGDYEEDYEEENEEVCDCSSEEIEENLEGDTTEDADGYCIEEIVDEDELGNTETVSSEEKFEEKKPKLDDVIKGIEQQKVK